MATRSRLYQLVVFALLGLSGTFGLLGWPGQTHAVRPLTGSEMEAAVGLDYADHVCTYTQTCTGTSTAATCDNGCTGCTLQAADNWICLYQEGYACNLTSSVPCGEETQGFCLQDDCGGTCVGSIVTGDCGPTINVCSQ